MILARGARRDLWLLAPLWRGCAAAVNPLGNFPLNDDWSYALTDRHLLDTGQFRPTGWTAMPLVTNTLWAAGYSSLRPRLGDYLPFLRRGRVAEYLRHQRIEYVVLPSSVDDERVDQWNLRAALGLTGRQDLTMTKVTECSGNVDAWQKYVRPMALAAPRQVLYRVVFMKSNDDS